MITATNITGEHCLECLMLKNTVKLKKDCELHHPRSKPVKIVKHKGFTD